MTGIEIIAVREIARENVRENVLDVVENVNANVNVNAAMKGIIPIQGIPNVIEVKRRIRSKRLLPWLEEWTSMRRLKLQWKIL